MNPNNNKRGRIRSNLISVESRLAKVAALDDLKEAIRKLIITEFSLHEVLLLVPELWNQTDEEYSSERK